METNPRLRRALMAVLNILSLILLGLVLQIGGAYLVNAAVNIMGSSDVSATASAAIEYSDFMEYIRTIEPKQLTNIIFVAPLFEEIVFRLFFLRAGKMVLPFWAANIIQAVLFGLYHTLTVQRVYGFVIGLVIGCVFNYCPIIYRNNHNTVLPDSLFGFLATFLLHVVINTAGIFVAPLLPADIAYSYQILAGSVLMVVAFAAANVLRVIAGKSKVPVEKAV